MKKTIQVKQNDDTGESYIDLLDFSDFLDISQVVSYQLDEEDDHMVLRFYDKDGNSVPARTPNE